MARDRRYTVLVEVDGRQHLLGVSGPANEKTAMKHVERIVAHDYGSEAKLVNLEPVDTSKDIEERRQAVIRYNQQNDPEAVE